MLRICFVCLGNICRSPTAEGIMLHLLRQRGLSEGFVVDSAGTAAYHVGEPPDKRSHATAKQRGVHLPSVARRFDAEDFARFDYVIAMDRTNQKDLLRIAPDRAAREKVKLLRDFCSESCAAGDLDVPDPYYGGTQGFEDVFDICQRACLGLLEHVTQQAKP
jgi:protein-tyrosine phosphatase